MNREQFETVATDISSKVTYTGAGTGILGFITSSQFLGLVGVLVALAGFLVNWYYKHKEDLRREQAHQRRMQDLAANKPDPMCDTEPGPLS
jgi:hypothetical protein